MMEVHVPSPFCDQPLQEEDDRKGNVQDGCRRRRAVFARTLPEPVGARAALPSRSLAASGRERAEPLGQREMPHPMRQIARSGTPGTNLEPGGKRRFALPIIPP
jgi:hypothetical protein